MPVQQTPHTAVFSPPVLQGHDADFVYQTIRHLVLMVGLVSLFVGLLFAAIGDQRLLWPIASILLVQLLALVCLWQKRIHLATIFIPVGIFVGAIFSSLITPQYYPLAAGFLGLTVIIAGALLGKRAAWFTAVVSLTVNLALYIYHTPTRDPLHIVLSSVQIILFTIVISLIMFYMNTNYQRLTKSYQTLEQTQQALQTFTQELQQTNNALRQSQQTKQAILDSIPDMMAIINRDGLYLDYKALSYFRAEDPPEFVIGKTVHDLLSPEMAAQRLERIAQVLDTKEVLEYEESQYARGEPRHFAGRIMALDEESVLVMMRDITREKEREQIALATQKLESIGLLAGGIAHDFNNLLTGMMAQTSLAIHKLEDDHPAVRHIQKANGATQRAADLTRQLLAYTGQGHFQLTQVDLNEILRENVDFLQAGLPRPVDIQLHLSPNLPTITADEGQIQQLIMNLIINAAEASPQPNAVIEISTTLCTKEALLARLQTANHPPPTLKSEQYISLTIRDEGVGMSPDTIQRIFDPFFTTKGHGRGLGLSAIWGIIRSYHGSIQVQSVSDAGTTFTIDLPTEGAPENITLEDSLTITNPHLPRISRQTTPPATQHTQIGPT